MHPATERRPREFVAAGRIVKQDGVIIVRTILCPHYGLKAAGWR